MDLGKYYSAFWYQLEQHLQSHGQPYTIKCISTDYTHHLNTADISHDGEYLGKLFYMRHAHIQFCGLSDNKSVFHPALALCAPDCFNQLAQHLNSFLERRRGQ